MMAALKITDINPENMAKPRGYSQAISVEGDHKTIYIGGQNAVDDKGSLVGKGNLRGQTEQALVNIEKILAAADAKLEDIVKLNIHILQGQAPIEGFTVFQRRWGASDHFPAITVTFVAGLGNPDWLIEIDAIAITPR